VENGQNLKDLIIARLTGMDLCIPLYNYGRIAQLVEARICTRAQNSVDGYARTADIFGERRSAGMEFCGFVMNMKPI